MDPHETVVKNPYAHISIPRAHLRPDLSQQLEASSSESQTLPCALEPGHIQQPSEVSGVKGAKGGKGATPAQNSYTREPGYLQQPSECPGAKGAKGSIAAQGSCILEPGYLQHSSEGPGAKGSKGQQACQTAGNPYCSGQRPGELTYSGLPPVARGDDIAHHCCCCPCCSCCHCPRFCRCHSCCTIS